MLKINHEDEFLTLDFEYDSILLFASENSKYETKVVDTNEFAYFTYLFIYICIFLKSDLHSMFEDLGIFKFFLKL